jgi:hypothetical protein
MATLCTSASTYKKEYKEQPLQSLRKDTTKKIMCRKLCKGCFLFLKWNLSISLLFQKFLLKKYNLNEQKQDFLVNTK